MAADQVKMCLALQDCLHELESQMSVRFECLAFLIEATAAECKHFKVRGKEGDAILANQSAQVFLPICQVTTEDNTNIISPNCCGDPSLPSYLPDCGDVAGPTSRVRQLTFTQGEASIRKTTWNVYKKCDQQLNNFSHSKGPQAVESLHTSVNPPLDTGIYLSLVVWKEGGVLIDIASLHSTLQRVITHPDVRVQYFSFLE